MIHAHKGEAQTPQHVEGKESVEDLIGMVVEVPHSPIELLMESGGNSLVDDFFNSLLTIHGTSQTPFEPPII